jgi:hypothetical protein
MNHNLISIKNPTSGIKIRFLANTFSHKLVCFTVLLLAIKTHSPLPVAPNKKMLDVLQFTVLQLTVLQFTV